MLSEQLIESVSKSYTDPQRTKMVLQRVIHDAIPRIEALEECRRLLGENAYRVCNCPAGGLGYDGHDKNCEIVNALERSK